MLQHACNIGGSKVRGSGRGGRGREREKGERERDPSGVHALPFAILHVYAVCEDAAGACQSYPYSNQYHNHIRQRIMPELQSVLASYLYHNHVSTSISATHNISTTIISVLQLVPRIRSEYLNQYHDHIRQRIISAPVSPCLS